jgi:hypothetical protein
MELNGANKESRFSYMESKAPQVVTRFSHIVIIWTDPAKPSAAADVLAGAEKYLEPVPPVRNAVNVERPINPRRMIKQRFVANRENHARMMEAAATF